jgi:hypothetical protein
MFRHPVLHPQKPFLFPAKWANLIHIEQRLLPQHLFLLLKVSKLQYLIAINISIDEGSKSAT